MKKVLLFIFLLLISILVGITSPSFSSSTEKEYVISAIFIPPKNVGEIYSLAYSVSNPQSPLYHHFLNETEIQKFFDVDKYEKMINYLKSNGIQIIGTALDSVIVINSTVLQLEELLNTTVHFNKLGNYTYYEGVGEFEGSIIVASNFTSAFLNKPPDLVTPNLISQMEKKAITLNFTYADESYPVTELLKAYNATVLNATGKGYTIGILDFYGDPTIVQQLAYFDKVYHIPPPPSFKIEYIGSPCPFGGIITGWNLEISLDVEVAHAIAPKANIILYVANPDLPLPYILAKIVQEDKVNVLSQSWGIPESEIVDNPSNLLTIYEANLYYALGSLEGITFLASTGDAGGSGYSTSPIGSVMFPSTSPFVTAVGGTTTYISGNESYQTAWSNYGFIPYFINYGGSTGGISVLFVKPWYQSYLQTPPSYPEGRMVPDVSLNANVYPGIQVVFPGNITYVVGGTSESSPLFAGLLTLIMQKDNTTLGLINPLLYYLGEKYYNEAFYPITFGYNIPWTAHYGYNLVTGLGAPNIGEIAKLILNVKANTKTEITVSLYNITGNSTFYFLPLETMTIVANITNEGKEVSSGQFFAYVYTLQGEIAEIELHFNGSKWVAEYIIPPNVEGPIEVVVKGNGSEGFTNALVGYIMKVEGNLNVVLPVIRAEFYNLYGERVNITNANITIYQYNPLNNSYVKVQNVILKNGYAVLDRNLTAGPILIVGNNVYGYISTFAGSSLLLNTLIIPPVVVEPGVVSAGASLFIEPTNLPLGNINISAVLYNQEGKVISYANLSWVLIPFDGVLAYVYIGYLKIPNNVTPGYYTIILNEYSQFGNSSILDGRYYSQIYVVPANLSYSVKFSGLLAEGNNVKIIANITYPNGSEVKFGMFSATVYPIQLQSNYEYYTEIFEIPLWFNGSYWVGNFTLPSTYTQGNFTFLSGNYYGPFGVFIVGVSANGYPTTNNLNAEKEFIVQPYTLIRNQTVTFAQPFYSIFENDLIKMNGNLTYDILINDEIINSNITISNSQFSNLVIKDSYVILINVVGGEIKAINSTVVLVNSKVNLITLYNSKIYNTSSIILSLSPPLPSVSFNGEEVIINGSQIERVEIYLNGKLIYNGTSTIVPIALGQGYNQLLVKVYQYDGEVLVKEFYAYVEGQSLGFIALIIAVIALALIVLKYLLQYIHKT